MSKYTENNCLQGVVYDRIDEAGHYSTAKVTKQEIIIADVKYQKIEHE